MQGTIDTFGGVVSGQEGAGKRWLRTGDEGFLYRVRRRAERRCWWLAVVNGEEEEREGLGVVIVVVLARAEGGCEHA